MVLQIVTGVCLAMHYTAHVDLAFSSVQHIMRDVPSGWLLRYIHANGASLFFIVVYVHIFRGIYYTSYAQPRELVWLLGVVLLLLTIMTAFIGYILPWGRRPQISNIYAKRFFYDNTLSASRRIGVHSKEIIDTIVGNLLGDGHAEKRANATRITIHMSSKNMSYLFWLHDLYASSGYCSKKKPHISKFISKSNSVYYSLSLKTFSFISFNFLYDAFYHVCKKKVPENIDNLLNPRVLAFWFMDDGGKGGYGLKLSTESFSYTDVVRLANVISLKFNLICTVQNHGYSYVIYFPKSEILKFRKIVLPYMIPSMMYKLK